MIHRLAVKWTDLWADSHIIDVQQKEVYQYGLELLVSTILNCALMIAVSYVIGIPSAFVLYAMVYIPLRLTAGGYHAGSHWRCIIYTQTTFALSVLSVRALVEWGIYYSLILIILLSGSAIFCLAPIESENNPLSMAEIKRGKCLACILECIVLLIVMVWTYKGNICTDFVMVWIAADISVAFSLVTAKIRQVFLKRDI